MQGFMKKMVCPAVLLALAGSALASGSLNDLPAEQRSALQRWRNANPSARVEFNDAGRVFSLYGVKMAFGDSPEASAQNFLDRYARAMGASAGELRPLSWGEGQTHVIAIAPDLATGELRLHVSRFQQHRAGVPVYQGEVRVLSRNEPGYAVVLADNSLRDLGGFVVDRDLASNPNWEAARNMARAMYQQIDRFEQESVVIWAGAWNEPAEPRLAVSFIGEGGTPADLGGYVRMLFIADAQTGRILHRENQVLHVDVTGRVQGNATTGTRAAECDAEVATPLPYARVRILNGSTVYADAEGNFTIPNGGNAPVQVEASIALGRFFEIRDQSGPVETLTLNVQPPGPANFLFNQANTQLLTAQVNAYYHSNVVRDFTLSYNPNFPTIGNQLGFDVNVNLAQTCNAFYNGSSINFYTAGGGCFNTAFSTVVHHEYGHHLVNRVGSGQGQYGEGTGDTMGVLITDDPVLARGFTGNCNNGIRTALNNLTYPCNSNQNGIHGCGQLLSGVVWDLRTALGQDLPDDARDITANLFVNSMPLRSAGNTEVDNSLPIHFLQIDDDNGDLDDGTPHYDYIYEAFTDRRFTVPEISPLRFEYDALPELIDPEGGVEFVVTVLPNGAQPQPNTGLLWIDDNGDGIYTPSQMRQVSPNVYEGSFPAIECGTQVSYYISAQATNGQTYTSPADAPRTAFAALSADSVEIVAEEAFERDSGWTIGANDDNATTGIWNRMDPQATAAQPEDDTTSNGVACFVTDGRAGNNLGDFDIDGGKTTLISPTFDLAGRAGTVISYNRWYSNTTGNAPRADVFVVEISNNNGQTWLNVETVGPDGEEVAGGWRSHEFVVDDIVEPTSQVRLRFVASDLGDGSIVEAAIDDLRIKVAVCGDDCQADLDGNGSVDGNDFLTFLSFFFANDDRADFDGNGSIDGGDFLSFLAAFFQGC